MVYALIKCQLLTAESVSYQYTNHLMINQEQNSLCSAQLPCYTALPSVSKKETPSGLLYVCKKSHDLVSDSKVIQN